MRTEFTKQTKRLAMERSGKQCEGILPTGERCCFPVDHKKHFDHVIPDALGGTNELSNCAVLCIACHDAKTRKIDVPLIAKAKRISDKHNGIRGSSSRPMPGSKASGIRKRMNGTVERRT